MRREHLSCEILLFLWLRVTKVIHFSSFHQKSVQSEGGDARLTCTFATWWAQVKCRCFCLAKMAFEWLLWEESASLKKGENELKQQVRECSKLDTAHLKPQDRSVWHWEDYPELGMGAGWAEAGQAPSVICSLRNSTNLKLLLSDPLIKQDYRDLLRESWHLYVGSPPADWLWL